MVSELWVSKEGNAPMDFSCEISWEMSTEVTEAGQNVD